MSERADIVVVGGGVIGLAVAYELARLGRRILLLERAPRTGEGASGAAAGMLAPVSEVEIEEPVLVDLGLDSLRRYPDFVAQLERLTDRSCRYRTEGTLWVALNRDQAEEIDHLETTLQARALAARRVSAEEMLEREPHLSGRALGGLLVTTDHQVDPRALCSCLETAIRRLGGEIRTGATVTEVFPGAERRIAYRTGEGEEELVDCAAAVLAAGAWADGIRTPFGETGIRPVKGQLVRLRGASVLRHVVRNPEVYLVPREDGELLVGATAEEQGFDTAPTAGAVLDLLRHAWQLVPALYDLELAEISVGLRPATADHLPLVGPAGTEGLFLASAHFRNGILLAPATAHYLAGWITEGRPAPELEPFLPDRGRAGREA